MHDMGVSPSLSGFLAARDPDFRKHLGLAPLEKDVTVGDVHVSSASDGKKKKKPPTMVDFNDALGAPGPAAKTFADIMAEVNGVTERKSFVDVLTAADVLPMDKLAPRALKPHPDGGAYAPFPHDPHALGSIPDKHVRRYMAAVTSPDSLEQRKVPINSLVSIQPRVSPEKVQSIQENGADKLPVVVRHNGKNIIADGTHRAAASWLDGETSIDAKYLRLAGDDEALAKEWSIPFEIKKTDDEQQMIFGWASVVQKGDYLIVDKQGDMILPEELERAAYDYVLEARNHGDAHTILGTGKLVESMVFTREKQDALGIRIIYKGADDQMVGWWVGFKINDEVWAKHKAGEYLEFSIGGSSASFEIEDT
jgi:Putative phage serine protease XkdF